ncbi:cyclin-domain-containing protein [Trichodelitschia bisporula]|uniref:Cyclin-domain-containing protein n=1 Tax=Trichodelitschia bisporula TaxID=703511 RepID=A0A6G1IA10_9PEZI|nr:cyclin-domain-containing protein [Trichodelitschia bisporula]
MNVPRASPAASARSAALSQHQQAHNSQQQEHHPPHSHNTSSQRPTFVHPAAAGLVPPSTQSSQRRPPPSPRFQPQSAYQTPTATPSVITSNLRAQPSSHFTQQSHVLPSSTSVPSSVHNSPDRSAYAPTASSISSPARIKVRSLSHIQSFVFDDNSPLSRSVTRIPGGDVAPQYEISDMPVTDIIEMVAGLLTKITTTNDRQHEHLHKHIPPPEGTAGLSQQTTSVLAFHGKNVPSISILSYLSRIHKYCPTTYEVFLSLLVYFDRMTERVNSGPLESLRQASQQSLERHASTSDGSRHSSVSSATLGHHSSPLAITSAHATTPPPSGSLGKPAEPSAGTRELHPPSPPIPETPLDPDGYNLSHFFVVDSFNIHRLVIAGVTCASKFFSDIFYTNSRYAKVGGLPLPELNHLELQFLLLNDFRLAVPLEEMEAYGTMLVEFYAREVLANQHVMQPAHSTGGGQPSVVS